MTAHKHAALMLEYAHDAAKTDKPWELWEFLNQVTGKWVTHDKNPKWTEHVEYRRKPRQVTLSVPKGETNHLEYGTAYYYPNIESMEVEDFTWVGDSTDRRILENGILYLNEADAQQAVDVLKTLFKGE